MDVIEIVFIRLEQQGHWLFFSISLITVSPVNEFANKRKEFVGFSSTISWRAFDAARDPARLAVMTVVGIFFSMKAKFLSQPQEYRSCMRAYTE